MKKLYKAPTIISEDIKIGVFGCYQQGPQHQGKGPLSFGSNWHWIFAFRGKNKKRGW